MTEDLLVGDFPKAAKLFFESGSDSLQDIVCAKVLSGEVAL